MINFFRKIRKELAFNNQFQKYLRYAIGEITLIMVGIFIALQLNNWNQKRLQEIQFKTSLEQLYNTITDDHELFETSTSLIENNIEAIDFLLDKKNQIYSQGFPYTLWSLSFTSAFNRNSQSSQLIENLDYDPQNKKHINISRQLQSYASLTERDPSLNVQFITKINDLLLEHDIAYPGFDLDKIQLGFLGDSTYYHNNEFERAKKLTTNNHFKALLKSERTVKTFQTLIFREQRDDAMAMLKIIKDYHPEAKLLIQDVGIIGTSINGYNDVGAKSTPMLLVNEEESIWEIELFLKVGTVKFRCRDSWAINWGGNNFPFGEAERHGPDISVHEAGNYKVVLNITKGTYEFIKREGTP